MDESSPPSDGERESEAQDTRRSLWHRVTATRGRRRALVAGALVTGALVAVPPIANTVASLVGPHPDATLRPVTDEADGLVRGMLAQLGRDSESSAIRGYEPYRGFEPWFFETNGFRCFMIVDRSASAVSGGEQVRQNEVPCVPPGVDLFADIAAWLPRDPDYMEGLPDGSIIRFHYREDSVDVFVYPASDAD